MSDALASPIQSEDFWFEDGDIVLSVTEDNVEHHFRVHRVILTTASPVFRDMLRLPMPQPLSGKSLLAPLRDDSIQDVTALLGELYTGRKVRVLTFDVALGILRIAHKYQIEGVQHTIKKRLLEDWPISHQDYVARLAYLGARRGDIIPRALKLIETAQRCQASELLPTAFYELSCAWGNQCEDIAKGLSHENVTRLWVGRARLEKRLRSFAVWESETPPLMWTRSNIDVPSTILQYRDNEKFKPCTGGQVRVSHLFSPRGKAFASPRTSFCNPAFSTFRTKLGERAFDGVFALSALQQLDRTHLEGNCEPCKDWFMSLLANKTQELWENIPADFDLPEVDPELYSQSQINTL